MSGSVETVEDRAGNVGELVDLLRGEPVQAFNDFHSGKFGGIPRQARLKYR